MTIHPTHSHHPGFVGRVDGIDLRQKLSDAQVKAIHEGMDGFGVLVFRGQNITDEQQIAFSQQLGKLEEATGDIMSEKDRRLSMQLNDISNLDQHGELLARDDRRRLFSLGNLLWHSDSSFKEIPAKYSLLSARKIPGSGGNTEFADMRAAYDALDATTRQEVHHLICSHSQIFSRGILGFEDFTDAERIKWAPVRQRLVRQHPRTGRLSLYLSSHAGGIEGWPVPEARAFLRDLNEHATQRQFVYAHVWQPGDLVMWDNRVTMHRARRYDPTQVRDMRRTTLTNEVSSLEQGPASEVCCNKDAGA
jgi:alpha-ketoglutarate-dependent 2,4-dichlorophenoxyacetate dioxygenase